MSLVVFVKDSPNRDHLIPPRPANMNIQVLQPNSSWKTPKMLQRHWAALPRTAARVALASTAYGAELRELPIRGVGLINSLSHDAGLCA